MAKPPRLQPLRIPAGWCVSYNEWYELDPEGPGHWLQEDLFQATFQESNLLLDVGWYGGYPDGEFLLQLLRGDFQDGEILHEFRSKSQSAVVHALEVLLAAPAMKVNPTDCF